MNIKSVAHSVIVTLSCVTISNQIYASGFQLIENSASGQGNAYAGAAATAGDASTVWFNPAGMMKLDKSELLAVGHMIEPSSSFINNGSVDATGAPLTGANDDGGATALVANLYYVTDINSKMKFGFGMTTPFGLAVVYDDSWVGRYHGVESDLKTINFNPSIAYEVNNKLSIGAGINIMLADVTLSSALDFGAFLGAPQLVDGFVTLRANNLDGPADFAYGFNFGVLYDVSNDMSLGIAYRSEITIEVEGTGDFIVPAAAAPVLAGGAFQDSAISGEVALPSSLSVSVAYDIDKLRLLGDVTWTGWSSFDELRIVYANPDQPDSVTTEEWEDTMRYSIGADYKYDNKTTLRAGIAYDETPVPSAQRRTPRLPGNSRRWISFGGTYEIDNSMVIDIGYSHLFMSDTQINNTFESSQPALAATVTGTYEAKVDILSAQARYKF